MMRHAIMIMAHADWPALFRLVEELDHPDIDIYVHINKCSKDWDPKFLDGSTKYSKVIFVPRMRIEYCNYSQVRAICSLLDSATKGQYDYYHLISGSDLPLHSTQHFLEFFYSHRNKEFISYYQEENLSQYRYHRFFSNSIRTAPRFISLLLKKLDIVLLQVQERLKINLLYGYKGIPRKCSDWWSITHKAAILILEKEPEFRKYFKHVFCPSELLAQTIIFNSNLRSNIYDLNDPNRGSLRLIDWDRGTPYVWKKEDFKDIISSPNMFGRKFNHNIDANVISDIYVNRNGGKKKLLVVNIGSGLGGIETSMITFLKFLVSEGHSVDLYLWRKPGELFPLIPSKVNILTDRLRPPKRCECRSLHDWNEYIHMRVRKILGKDYIKLFKPINKFYDVAIAFCQNGHTPYYVQDKVCAARKILFYHHGSYEEKKKVKERDRKYYAKYDIIDAISHVNKEMLSSAFPELAPKITYSGNLIDSERIKTLAREKILDLKKDSKQFYICTVARVSPEKGITLIIETAKILTNNGINFKWFVVGGGTYQYQNECHHLTKQYHLNNQVIFVGNQENPYSFINLCDLYVQPSLVESFSICIREAAILKKPIITTNLPAFIAATEDIDGIITTSVTPRSLSKAIMNALSILNSENKASLNTHLKRDINLSIKDALRKNLT